MEVVYLEQCKQFWNTDALRIAPSLLLEINKKKMFAIGNEELETLSVAKKTAKCPACKKNHRIMYGTTDGKENKTIGFVKHGTRTYLVAFNGKLLI